MSTEPESLVARVRAEIDRTAARPRLLTAAVAIGVAASAFALFVVVVPARSVDGSDPDVVMRPGIAPSGFPSGSAAPDSAAAPEPVTAGSSALVVDVVGAVRRPGVVRLPAGARVLDAIAAAGGLLPGAGGINLARPLADGEQLVVAARGQDVGGAAGEPGTTAGVDAAAGLLDLNLADAAALEELPGVGPVLAGRIVAWRTKAGRFDRVEQLDEVSGIGPALYADIAPLVRVR